LFRAVTVNDTEVPLVNSDIEHEFVAVTQTEVPLSSLTV